MLFRHTGSVSPICENVPMHLCEYRGISVVSDYICRSLFEGYRKRVRFKIQERVIIIMREVEMEIRDTVSRLKDTLRQSDTG